jgi:hypothetical protein
MTKVDRIKELELEIKELEDALCEEEFGSCVYDYLSVDLMEAEIELKNLKNRD